MKASGLDVAVKVNAPRAVDAFCVLGLFLHSNSRSVELIVMELFRKKR